MKISLEQSEGLFTLHSYRDGVIKIRPPGAAPDDDEGLKLVQGSCLLSGDKLIEDWAPQGLDELSGEHLKAIEGLEAELLLIGTGSKIRFPDNEQRAALIRLGIGHEVMDTAAACRTYNVLVSEGRKVVAALFTQ